MPNLDAPNSKRHNGWYRDQKNGVLEWYYNGTKIAQGDANATLTTASNLVVATNNLTVTAGDLRVTAGNARLGALAAFASTEPTSALVMKQGTAFAGAITTSGGIMSNGTVVRKIIADGTVSNIET